MWEKLSAVLKEINGYYEMLYTLNVKKRNVLVAVDMKLLAEIIKKEEQYDKFIGLARKSFFIILNDSSISHLPLVILSISSILPTRLVVNA